MITTSQKSETETRPSFNKRAAFYALCGLVAYVIDQVMNLEFMISQEGKITSLVIAVPVAGLLCSITLASMNQCIKKRDFTNALLLFGVFCTLGAFSLGASIYRAGESYDAKISKTKSLNKPIKIAQRSVEESKLYWQQMERAVLAETSNGGCGPICHDKKQLAKEALQRYEIAKSKHAKLGSIITADPMAKRLAEILSIPEQNVQTLYPLLLPLGIWLASIAFIGIAINETDTRNKPLRKNSGSREELPLSLQIAAFMDQQEQLDGKRPTQEEAAKHFGVSRSTVSRQLARLK